MYTVFLKIAMKFFISFYGIKEALGAGWVKFKHALSNIYYTMVKLPERQEIHLALISI